MADGLPKELTSGEKVYINSFLREPPQWIRWVKKTNKKNAIQPRLMVVTKYRVFSIKRNKMGKKQIVREAHLFDLKEVSTDDLDRCTLVFKDFKIVAFAPTLGVDLPRVVLQSFYNISFTFSDAAFPKLTMSPEGRSPPNIERTPPGPAAGFEEVYLAQCDYLGVKYSPDIIIMVDDLFASSNPSLDLDQCTGIEKESEYSINLAPVFAALRHNTFFTSFSLHDKSRSETVRGLAENVLTHNVTLTSVDISGADISSEESWEAFGEAIKSNQRNVLYHMNLSDNQYGEKGVIPVSAAISAIPHAMSSVKASNTGMQAKGITQFFRSLTGNLQLSCALEEVDVSSNSVAGGPLSVAVADWLVAIDAYQPALENKRLRVLNLSACAIDIPPVVDALRNTLYATIQHLDLSNNKIEEYSVQLLATLLGKATALTHLNVSNCGLTAIFLTSLISGTSVNTVMPNFTLDISGNDLSKEDQAIIGMAGAIATCKNIHTLKMGEMNLKRESLIPICKAIGENVTLQGLDFSGNFKHGAVAGKGENPLDLLVNSIKIHPTLTYFGCAGKKDNQLAKDIIPLFKVLVDNNRLLEFDVSHNNFGDDGARDLFDTLRTNYCLKTLSFDYNINITYSGWQALRRCIIVNRSLTDIKYPKKDITKTILNAKDKPDMHLKLRELFIDIAIYTHNNLNNQTDERPLQPSPKPPIPTPPFELFLSFASQQFGSSSPAVDYNQRYSQIQPVSQTASLYNIPPVYSSSPTPQTGTYGSPSRPASVMSPPSPSSSSPYMSSPGSHASVYNAPPPPGAFSGSGYDRASTAYDSRSSVYNAPPPPSSSLYNSNGYDEYDASVDLPTRPGGTMRPVSTRAAPPPPPPANPMTVPIPPPLSPSHSTPPTLTPPPPLSTPPSLSTPPMGSRNSSVLSPSLSNKNLPTLPPLPPMPPLPSSPLPSLPGAGSYNNNNSPATARVPPPPPAGVGRVPPPPPPGDPYPAEEYDENGYQYDSNQYDSSAQYDNSQYDNSGQYDNTQYDNSGYSYDYENQGEEFEDLTPNNNASRNPPPAPHYQF